MTKIMSVALYHKLLGKNEISEFSRDFFTFPYAISCRFIYCDVTSTMFHENVK